MPEFPAITHVALTVTDLGRSRPWYQRLFGSDPVVDEDTGPFHHVVWLLGGTLVGIHYFPDLKSTEPFDERRPGLDHLAFACANRSELEVWEQHLNELGIANGGIVDASYGSGLSFRDPDNIALEILCAPWIGRNDVVAAQGDGIPFRSQGCCHEHGEDAVPLGRSPAIHDTEDVYVNGGSNGA